MHKEHIRVDCAPRKGVFVFFPPKVKQPGMPEEKGGVCDESFATWTLKLPSNYGRWPQYLGIKFPICKGGLRVRGLRVGSIG